MNALAGITGPKIRARLLVALPMLEKTSIVDLYEALKYAAREVSKDCMETALAILPRWNEAMTIQYCCLPLSNCC